MKNEAEHEAAHAVSAWRQGEKINFLTVGGPLEEFSGYSTACYCTHTGSTSNKNTSFLIKSAPMALRRDIKQIGDLNDILRFMKEVRPENLMHLKMVESAWELLHPDMMDEPENFEEFLERYQKPILKFYERFKKQAEELMASENIQRCVAVLAEELNKKKQLSGYEVADILEKNWKGDLPSSVLPKERHATNQKNPRTPQEAQVTATALVEMAFNILRDHSDSDEVQGPLRAVLQCLFQLKD